MTVVHSAYIGGLTGVVKRKGRGTPTVIVSSLIAGFAFGAVNVGALTVLTRLRHLIFEVMTANVDGVAAFLTRMHMQGRRRRPEAVFRRWRCTTGRGCCWSITVVAGPGRVVDRLVGVVPAAGADARYPRCAQTGRLGRKQGRGIPGRAGSGAVGQGALPLPRRRPRRAARGQPGSAGRRTRRGHRSQRFREDHVDADPGRPGTDVGHRGAPRRGGSGQAGRHGRCPAAPGKPGPGHPGRRRCGVGPAAGYRNRRRPVAERGRPRGSRRTRHRKPVRR